MEERSPNLQGRLRGIRIIHLALVTGCMSFAGVAIFCRMQPWARAPEQPILGLTGLAFGVIMAMSVLVIPPLIESNWRQKLARGIDPLSTIRPPQSVLEAGGPVSPPPESETPEHSARWWALYQTRLIITAAMIESVIFFQLVAYLIEGAEWSLGLAGLFLMGLVMLFPTQERVERWIRRQHELVEEAKRNLL